MCYNCKKGLSSLSSIESKPETELSTYNMLSSEDTAKPKETSQD